MTAKNTEGTWGHSDASGGTTYAIFSVDRAGDKDLIEITSRRHAVMAFMAGNGIDFKAVWGCYKGLQELSYVVETGDLPAIADTGLIAGQESILELGACDARDRRPATLVYLTHSSLSWIKREDLGLFQQVSEDVAKAQDGYTFDPTTNHYFACLPNKPFVSDRQKLDAILGAYDKWSGWNAGSDLSAAINAAR